MTNAIFDAGIVAWDNKVAYDSVRNGTESTSRVSVAGDGTPANSNSWDADISDDSRYVAMFSYAINPIFGDNNAARDVFVLTDRPGL